MLVLKTILDIASNAFALSFACFEGRAAAARWAARWLLVLLVLKSPVGRSTGWFLLLVLLVLKHVPECPPWE